VKNDDNTLEEKLYQEFNFDFVCLRHKLGLTQQEMAAKSNVLRDKIAKIERGIYPPNIRSLLKILGPLGYTLKIGKIEKEAIDERK
jgi:transcriptional regulator with XRE-family HTH domain